MSNTTTLAPAADEPGDDDTEIVVIEDTAPAEVVEVVDVPATAANLQPDQLADWVCWTINQIADKGYVPGAEETPWAGRQDIIADVAQKFDVSAEYARVIVQEAHNALRLADPALVDKSTRRALQLHRLENLRQMILRASQEKVVETTFAFDEELVAEGENRGKKVFKKRKIKEKVSPPDLAAYSGRLLDIYRMENDLLGLTGAGASAATATRQILAEMEETVESKDGKKTTRQSVVNSIRMGDVSALHPQSQQRFMETITKAAEQARTRAADKKAKGNEENGKAE